MSDMSLDQIVYFLSSTRLFRSLDIVLLKKIAPLLKVTTLQGGDVLMRQGEVGDSLYIVVSGRLRAFINDKDGKIIPVGEIGNGEIVGEIALIIGIARTATVKAIRDSVLLEFKRADFEQFTKKFPEVGMDISRFCVKRLVEKKRIDQSKFVTIAFVPAGENPNFSEFVSQVANLLEGLGSTLYLSATRFNDLYGKDVSQLPFNDSENSKIAAWLHEQESRYKYVIYEADPTLSQWSLRCLRQADRVILVGLFGTSPSLNDVEKYLTEQVEKDYAITDLVLLHKTSDNPVNTIAWLEPRRIHDHHHIRIHSAKDYAKFIRFMTGRALGLILSGGGMRASAYVGLFRALEELKINIDFIGANSAGALHAGLFAKGLSYKEIMVLVNNWAKNFKYDYTLPVVSLSSGKFVTNELIECLGEVAIEDLWTRYFCTSTNLSQNTLRVHTRGSLWKSVRASGSIPGVFPPVIDENGEVFVDGGIINNFPVDVMRNHIGSGKIIAVNLTTKSHQKYDQIDYATSGWKLFFDKIMGRKKRLPSVGEQIVLSMVLASMRLEDEATKQADYLITLDLGYFGLFQTKGVQDLINHSYNICIQELEKFFNV